MGKATRNREKRAQSPEDKIHFKARELRKSREFHKRCIERIDEKIKAVEAEKKKLEEEA